jgi:hypothetical protein
VKELEGNVTGAERLYEQAAMGGDLGALGRLGQLRAMPGAEQDADRLYGQAAAERNTGVMFSLAAAGHTGALRLLGRLLAEAAAPAPSVPAAAPSAATSTEPSAKGGQRHQVATRRRGRNKRRRSR